MSTTSEKLPTFIYASATIAFILITMAFWGGLDNLVFRWIQREEYSHGFFIPLISIFLLWHRREALVQSIGQPSWMGLLLVIVATGLLIVGELSAIFILIHLGFIIGLMGLVLALGGWSLLRVAFLPLAFLVFAIPMPYFIDAQLSWGLQLISSQLGVDLLRLMGVTVFLEGNVIDLGNYKLQVVDACSGLRYLYPLLSLGFLAAYLFSAPMWQRILVFVSTIPITIFMNSFRIAVIGVLVERWGTEMAEGFLHFFEGWVIFMGCALLLMLEIWLLDRLGQKRSIGNLLAVPDVEPVRPSGTGRGGMMVLFPSFLVLGLSTMLVYTAGEREELQMPRQQLTMFPSDLGEWSARQSFLPSKIEQGLGVDDYLLADFKQSAGVPVNYYVAYYASQRKGVSPHSPRVCIPGGGWQITDITEIKLQPSGKESFPVNRAIIERGEQKQLVYYWFEQRGRRIANEYWMKWYLLKDALFMNRTDGALVRVTTAVVPSEEMITADERLQRFVAASLPVLPGFVPGG